MVTRLSIVLPLTAVCGLMMGCQASHKSAKPCHAQPAAKADKACHSPCHESSAKPAEAKVDSTCPKAVTADAKVCADKAAVGSATCSGTPAADAKPTCADASAAEAKTPSCCSAKVEPLPQEKDKPFAVVQRVKQAPRMNGVIDESWGEPTLTGFFNEDTRKPVKANVQTQVWLRYDDQNLYVVAKMLEPSMDDLRANVTERDSNVWEDDDVEIFLDPTSKADASDYLQLAVNSIGTLADQRGSPEVSGDLAWDCKGCQVKTGKGKDFWVVEMVIPFESLGVKGSVAGQHWGANFARERKCGAAENSTWSNIGPDWHQPEQFGHIAFQP
jgi:hypothetical protein